MTLHSPARNGSLGMSLHSPAGNGSLGMRQLRIGARERGSIPQPRNLSLEMSLHSLANWKPKHGNEVMPLTWMHVGGWLTLSS